MDKKLLIKIGVIAALIIVAELALSARGPGTDTAPQASQPEQAVQTEPEGSPAAEAAAPAPEAQTTPAAASPKKTAPSTATYDSALKAYGSQRIQFNDCRGTPGSMVLTIGARFMLDNRDNTAHTIIVGKTRYTLKAYGYAIAAAPAVGIVNITCDGGGAAQLNVQS